MAVHLAVAGDVFDGVLFCAVLFSLRDVLTEILDRIDSVPENFPTYSLFCAVLFSLRDVLTEILDRIDSVPENFPTYSLFVLSFFPYEMS